MELFDVLTIQDARKTRDGNIVANVRAARSGIQVYKGFEVGRPDLTDVRVFRPESEVFAKDSLITYAHRTVTLTHPDELVSPENWKHVAVGHTDGEVARDGEFVRVSMFLADKAAIDAVDSGIRQLSMGYTADIDWTDGTTPDGQQFDAVQRNMRMNHLAVVAAARGGLELNIGDDEGGQTMAGETNRSIMVDGVPVSLPDQSAAIVDKALKDAAARVTDAQTAATKATDDLTAANTAHEAALATKDAEIDKLKGEVVDAATLDAKVTARATLIDSARKIVPEFDAKAMSDAEIKRAVVLAKIGDTMKDKPEAYIDARFDMLVEDAPASPGVDPLRAHLATVIPHGDAVATAYEANNARMRDAWKGEDKKGAN